MGRTYWVYVLRCNNGNYYTEYTTDLACRYQEHAEGTIKCKYTRSFKPVEIAQSWQIDGDKSAAMRLERHIKNLSRSEKEQLIESPRSIEQLYLSHTLYCHRRQVLHPLGEAAIALIEDLDGQPP